MEVRNTNVSPIERIEYILHDLEVEYEGERPSLTEIKTSFLKKILSMPVEIDPNLSLDNMAVISTDEYMDPRAEIIQKLKETFADFIAPLEITDIKFEVEHISSAKDGIQTKTLKISYSN